MKQLLAIRKTLKSKKPLFTRHDAHKKKRVGTGWRRPKGLHNKMRLHRKGYAKIRSTGYGSPTVVRGLSAEGSTQNIVANLKDFSTLNPKTDGVIIGGTVGGKKKLVLLDYAEKNKFIILNIDAVKVKNAINEKLAAKKVKQKEIAKRKETKEQAKAKVAKEEKAAKEKEAAEKKKSESQEAAKSTEDTQAEKLEEKKEHDKVLTKKE